MFLRTNKYVAMVFCIMAIFALAACGSSGGSSSNSVTDNVVYTGKLTAAVITNSNGASIANASSGSMDMAGDVSKSVSSAGDGPSVGTLGLARNIAGLAQDALEEFAYNARGASAIVTDSGSMAGPCGGSASYTLSIDDVTYAFTGTFVFSNYCEGGETVSGTLVLSGTFDLGAGDFSSITMTFVNLSSSVGGETMTTSGTISMSVAGANTVTMSIPDFRVKDGSTNKVYMIRNYEVTIVDFGSYEVVTIASGDFYDHDEGKTSIHTTTAIEQNYLEANPYAGVLVINGASNTTVTLTYLNSSQYSLEIDSSGNGTPNVTISPINW